MLRKKLWLILASITLVLSLSFVLLAEAPVKNEVVAKTELAKVSTLAVEIAENQGQLVFFGEVKPQWSVTMHAGVHGEIKTVYAMAGEHVKQGQLLLSIEDSPYKTALAEAEQALAAAKMQLVEERTRLQIRTKNIEKLKSSQLPGIQAAVKAIAAAKAQIQQAQVQLSYTQVKAPFSGVLTKRHVSLGQIISSGDALYDLVGNQQLEVELHLSQKQWQMLSPDWKHQRAKLFNNAGHLIGQAKIKDGGGFVEPTTRQYSVFLQLDSDSLKTPVVPGSFVQVKLNTKAVNNSLKIPESALTRTGHIWFIDKENRLNKTTANVQFHQQGQVVVTANALKQVSNINLVVRPMASYLPGQLVKPSEVKSVKASPADDALVDTDSVIAKQG